MSKKQKRRKKIIRLITDISCSVIAAAVIICGIFLIKSNAEKSYVTSLCIDGERIGYIESSSVITEGKLLFESRIYDEYGYYYDFDCDFTLVGEKISSDNIEYIGKEAVASAMLEICGIEHIHGGVLYIDGKEAAFCESVDVIESVLERVISQRAALLSPYGIEFEVNGVTIGEDVRILASTIGEDELYSMLSDNSFPDWFEEYYESKSEAIKYAKENDIYDGAFDGEFSDTFIQTDSGDCKIKLSYTYTCKTAAYEIIERRRLITYEPYRLDDYFVYDSEGSDGERYCCYTLTYTDNYLKEKALTESVVIKEAVDAVYVQGLRHKEDKGVATGYMLWPTYYGDKPYITSFFGIKRVYDYGSTHRGIDLYMPTGTPVYACDGGIISDCGYNNSYGNYVIIDHDGTALQTVYGHLSSYVVEIGEEIAIGDLIAYSGQTGNVTAPHLHLEVRVDGEFRNPLDYMPNDDYVYNNLYY